MTTLRIALNRLTFPLFEYHWLGNAYMGFEQQKAVVLLFLGLDSCVTLAVVCLFV